MKCPQCNNITVTITKTGDTCTCPKCMGSGVEECRACKGKGFISDNKE